MDHVSTIKLLKAQIAQMTSSTYSNYKRIAELAEENNYLRKRVDYLENKLEQISDRKLNEG
tara:strand:+ start:181 stop:363 length:183 start_codon:yes stop_codon:yes gene_type:complete